MTKIGWPVYKANFNELELTRFIEKQALETFSAMLKKGINTPLASFCGPLFDAVAATMGICRESVSYEGQAARFHKGLAKVIVTMVGKLTTQHNERVINTIALSGGVFQNMTLLEQVVMRLYKKYYTILTHQKFQPMTAASH